MTRTSTLDGAMKSITLLRRQPQRGSLVHAVRWKPQTWDAIYDLVHEHKYEIKANRIAEVAVKFGVDFLRSLTIKERERLFGRKGTKIVTFQELQVFKQRNLDVTSIKAEILRLNDQVSLAVPIPFKRELRDEKHRTGITMSEQIRRRIILTKEVA